MKLAHSRAFWVIAYPDKIALIHEGVEIARHGRRFDRYQTVYDWRHYIPAVLRKPGALRNGAPFADLPLPLQHLRRHLLRQSGGDRVMGPGAGGGARARTGGGRGGGGAGPGGGADQC